MFSYKYALNNLSSPTAPTCSDGVKNANETDIDCGGWCAPALKCAVGQGCAELTDCLQSVCTNSTCLGEFVYFHNSVLEFRVLQHQHVPMELRTRVKLMSTAVVHVHQHINVLTPRDAMFHKTA